MLKTELQNTLNAAFEEYFFTNNVYEIAPKACAENFYDSHSELMEKLKRPWLIERLTKLAKNRKQRGWPNTSKSPQLTLPGFENLPRRIFLPNGTRKILDNATIGQIRDHLGMLRQRALEHTKIKQMEAVLALMEKYSTKQPWPTWAEVKQKELQADRRAQLEEL
jgi:hypothetical protein